MRTSLFAVALSLAISTISAYARDPLGQFAAYTLDRSRARTSALVSEGQIQVKILGFLPGPTRDEDAYQASIDYDLNILYVGQQKGSQALKIPSLYFGEELLTDLRAKKEITTPYFKLRYLGTEDVTTHTGEVYPETDVVLMYDLQTANDVFTDLVRSLNFSASQLYPFGNHSKGNGAFPQIQDLQITMHLSKDLPVLGAAQLDLRGTVSNIRIKMGFDYTNPTP